MIINILILSNAITIIGILLLLGINKKYYNILKENDCLIREKDTEIARISRKYNTLINSIKFEPKFKVDDWITCGNSVGQITSIENNYSCYKIFIGGINVKIPFTVQDNYHLWTIQDAKAGDILVFSYAFKNYILIYKGLHKKSFITIMSVFCFYCVEENTYYDETDFFHTMNRGEIITPATKEQRDTLMKAMADAGYTFDFEKKELNKIVPVFNIGDTIAKKHNSDIIDGKYWYNNRIICDIVEQDEWEFYNT